MADVDTFDDDIFDDLYDEEPASKPAPAAPAVKEPEVKAEPVAEPRPDAIANTADTAPLVKREDDGDANMNGSAWNGAGHQSHGNTPGGDDNYGPINVKEDGKMFIGGLNWETTEESLKNYFSQFGEVSECTVMRDSATGRSRGFGFLTFRDPKCVNIVMVKEHYLDGKIIDPKRAIPREEQERTSKIFVGGVSQEASEEDFKNFFKQFGRVVDATLMMDKDTGRPRGFGFVTFDGDAAVDACLSGPLQILGKPIEVKRAQPRGNMRDDDDGRKFGRGGGRYGSRDSGDRNAGFSADSNQTQNQNQGGATGQMTPAMMAQYWQRMQQYFRQMQQNLAASAGGMPNPMGGMPGGMNPAMMGMMGGMSPGSGSPNPAVMGGPMNPAMMQQMQQLQQMQMNQGGGYGGGNQAMMGGGPRPGYTAIEQQIFEQQKYEQQQARRMQQQAGYGGQGGPTSWEGMYDDIPQPSNPVQPGFPGGGAGHHMPRGGHFKPAIKREIKPGNAPANAPTGPKNAGKPGANYRGGGRNANYRHNPYGGGRNA